MILEDFIRISKYTNDCANCGNDNIGGGEGTLHVNDEHFERSCKCGFTFTYDAIQGTSAKQVKKALADVLAKYKNEKDVKQ